MARARRRTTQSQRRPERTGLLKRTEEKREQRVKERLDDYYNRNFEACKPLDIAQRVKPSECSHCQTLSFGHTAAGPCAVVTERGTAFPACARCCGAWLGLTCHAPCHPTHRAAQDYFGFYYVPRANESDNDRQIREWVEKNNARKQGGGAQQLE